ncbi:hypothetical protein CTI14_56860, partial [Methylobacterium radiotolerans]
LAPSWWRRIPARELGPVVLRLRQASAAARLNTVAELEDEGLVFAASEEPTVPPIPSPDADSLDMSALRAGVLRTLRSLRPGGAGSRRGSWARSSSVSVRPARPPG